MTEGQKKKIFDGRYDILSIVGRGACSVVYHARHISPPASDVALKVLLNKNGERANGDRLRKEALAMVSSRHRYVIRLDDFHSVGDLCYLSMEYAPESDLRKFAARSGGKLSHVQAERFLLQAAEALGFIHRAGIIHRDIKPDNILAMNSNEIRLGDFGVAVLPGEESSLDELQRGIGTMDYMAPEVLEGIRYDQRSDVYALAVTFYELISGRHPFAGLPMVEQLGARKDGAVQPLSSIAPGVPEYLSAVIMRGMSYSEDQRFGTGREMLQALLVAKSETTSPSPTSSVPPQGAPTSATLQPQSTKLLSAVERKSSPGTKQPVVKRKESLTAKNSQDSQQVATETTALKAANSGVVDTPPRKPTLAPLSPGKIAAGKAVAKADAAPAEAHANSQRRKAAPLSPAPQPPLRESPKTTPPMEPPPQSASERDDDTPVAPGNALPGIGLKRDTTSPTIPVKSSAGVTVKEPMRRETVAVSAAEMAAARQGSKPEAVSPRATVSLTGVNSLPGAGLASSPLQGAEESDEEPNDFDSGAGPSPLNLEPAKLAPPGSATSAPQTIKGFHGKLKKVSSSDDSSHPTASSGQSSHSALPPKSGIRAVQFLKRITLIIIAGGLLLTLSNSFLHNSKSAKKKKSAEVETVQEELFSNGESVTGIPAVASAEISFPNLPEGMYTGSILGLAPGDKIPLTIISTPESAQIHVIVGIPGWTGASSELPELSVQPGAPVPPLRVSSNGSILEMTGEVIDGTLTGFVRNLVTGEQGQWSASPVREGR